MVNCMANIFWEKTKSGLILSKGNFPLFSLRDELQFFVREDTLKFTASHFYSNFKQICTILFYSIYSSYKCSAHW